jgi:hypothetical protein
MTPSKNHSAPARPRKPAGRRYRLSVAARVLAALPGGYVLGSLTAALLALTLPLSRDEAVQAGALVSLAVYPATVLWVFSARTALRAWLGIALPGIMMGAAVWMLRGGLG